MLRLLQLAIGLAVGVGAVSLLRAERAAARDRPAPGPRRAGSCVAVTRAGRPCSRPAEPGSDRCWQHAR